MTKVLPLLWSVRLLLEKLRLGELLGLATMAETVLTSAPPGRLLAVDAELRRFPATADVYGSAIGIIGLLSMQRDGYVREAATQVLGGREESIAFRLLLVRCNDAVPEIATAAGDGLTPWLVAARAATIAEALPLVEALRRTARAAKSPALIQLDMLLASPSTVVDRALREAAAQSTDTETRRIAIAKLAARNIPTETLSEILGIGLRDTHPSVRLSSARLAVSKATPTEVSNALLPMLERDAAPAVRLLALRARRQRDPARSAAAITSAALDSNANVRHHARTYIRRLHLSYDSRAAALARLCDPDASAGALVGALAALSDMGRKKDTAKIHRFAAHSIARVRREAERTLSLLSSLPS